MARPHKYDPYGEKYWHLTREQGYLLAALPIEYRRLRDVIDQVTVDNGIPHKRIRWEKLHVLGYLEVDPRERSWVMVRRGPKWAEEWNRLGVAITQDSIMTKEFGDEIEKLLAGVDFSSD